MSGEISDQKNISTVSIVSKIDNDGTNRLEVLPQLIAVVVKNILMLPIGMTLGFITILIPRIVGSDSNERFTITEEQVSWLGSSVSIASCIGSFGSSFISQPFGRRPVMIFMTIPFFTSWIIYYFVNEIWHIFFALSLSGLCGGLIAAAVYSYVVEISQPHIRGMMAATSSLTVVFGVFIEIIIATFLPWRIAALVSSSVPITAFCCLWFLPESPYWLISKQREEDARKSLAWFRGWTTTESVEKEFQEIKSGYKKKQTELHSIGTITNVKNKLKLFLRRNFLFPLFLVSFLFFLANFTGILTLQTYGTLIFATLDVPINKYYATVLMGSCELVGCLLSIFLVRCLGKRKMGLASLFCLILCDSLVGIYAFVNGIESLKLKVDFENVTLENVSGNQWMPLCLLLCVSFTGHCGLRSLPWIVVGEVFSFETRGLGCGICISVFAITSFLVNKTFLNMIASITFYGVYWFYAAIGCAGFIIIYFLLPETEGKTLQEINNHFEGEVKLDNKVRKKSKVYPVIKERYVDTA